MPKVDSDSYMKYQLQSRSAPQGNRQWERCLCPKSSSPLSSHDFQRPTIFTLCVTAITERERLNKHKFGVLSVSARKGISDQCMILKSQCHRMVPNLEVLMQEPLSRLIELRKERSKQQERSNGAANSTVYKVMLSDVVA